MRDINELGIKMSNKPFKPYKKNKFKIFLETINSYWIKYMYSKSDKYPGFYGTLSNRYSYHFNKQKLFNIIIFLLLIILITFLLLK